MKSVIRDGYTFTVSTRPNKKYDVYKAGKYLLSFGDIRYKHYFDKIGLLPKSLNHLDKQRRALYYKRHGQSQDRGSAKYFSNMYLW